MLREKSEFCGVTNRMVMVMAVVLNCAVCAIDYNGLMRVFLWHCFTVFVLERIFPLSNETGDVL